MKHRIFDTSEYNNQVQNFIKKSEMNNRTIPCDKLRFEGLPDARWFIKNCPDPQVTCWSAFVDWCGFYGRGYTSKEKAINLIYKKAESLNRPLSYKDFCDIGCYEVPLIFITKTWGTINKMKEELGLEIIQEDMSKKSLTKNGLDNVLLNIKQYVDENNLPFITRNEIDNNSFGVKTVCLDRWCKHYYNKTLGEKLKDMGLYVCSPSRGYVHYFDDGEKTTSQFEYLWSLALRQYGLKYNLDYKRDIPYRNFINSYNGNMNCDYVLNYHNRIIYIEIPGIIEAYKEYYYSDKQINNKLKEKYRQKLKTKEQMLKNEDCEYYFLFPCDLTVRNLEQILKGDNNNLRQEIEKYHKHNIKWNNIFTIKDLK